MLRNTIKYLCLILTVVTLAKLEEITEEELLSDITEKNRRNLQNLCVINDPSADVVISIPFVQGEEGTALSSGLRVPAIQMACTVLSTSYYYLNVANDLIIRL